MFVYHLIDLGKMNPDFDKFINHFLSPHFGHDVDVMCSEKGVSEIISVLQRQPKFI